MSPLVQRILACIPLVAFVACARRDSLGEGLDAAMRAVTAARDAGAAQAALAAFEVRLDEAAPSTAAEVAAWIGALSWLERLEASGWKPHEGTAARSKRRLAASVTGAAGSPASRIEAALAGFMLRRRDAHVPGWVDVPLAELADVEHPSRYARSDGVDAAWVLIVLARIHRDAGQHDSALRCLHLAATATVCRGWEGITQRCFVALERASCLQTLGRNLEASQAIGMARSAVDGSDATDAPPSEEHERMLQVVELARLRFESETGLCDRALETVTRLRERSPADDIAAQVQYYEAVALRGHGDIAAADAALVTALGSDRLDRKLRCMALLDHAAAAISDGDLERARGALDDCHRIATLDGASSPLLTAREGGLRAALLRREGGDPRRVAEAIDLACRSYHDFLDAWSASDDGSAAGILGFAPRRRLIEEVITLALEHAPAEQGVALALEEALRARAAGGLARALGAPRPTLAAIRRLLTPRRDTGLLVFVPGFEHTHAFAVDSERLVHVLLPRVEQIGSAIDDLWRELAPSPLPDLAASRARCDAAQRRLSDLVVAPGLREQLRDWKSFVFVGNDVMRHLPIDLLMVDDKSSSAPLGEHTLVSELPSTAVGLALAAAAPVGDLAPCRRTRVLALVAPSAPGGDALEAVVFDARARDRLRSAVPGLTWHEGADAVLESIDARDGALLWFAHGVFDPQRARPSGVRVAPSAGAPSGHVFPDDLDRLDLRVPPLCLLASCGASNVEVKLGSDDSDHLGASLLRKGARMVFLAAAPLEQEATARLCASMLAEFAGGASPPLALRRARAALRAEPRFDHPHYWSTFVAYGLWQ